MTQYFHERKKQLFCAIIFLPGSWRPFLVKTCINQLCDERESFIWHRSAKLCISEKLSDDLKYGFEWL